MSVISSWIIFMEWSQQHCLVQWDAHWEALHWEKSLEMSDEKNIEPLIKKKWIVFSSFNFWPEKKIKIFKGLWIHIAASCRLVTCTSLWAQQSWGHKLLVCCHAESLHCCWEEDVQFSLHSLEQNWQKLYCPLSPSTLHTVWTPLVYPSNSDTLQKACENPPWLFQRLESTRQRCVSSLLNALQSSRPLQLCFLN